MSALVIFYMLFSFLDYRIDPDSYWNFFFIRFIVVAPLSILFIVATFQKWFKKVSQLMTSFMMILGASGIIYMVLFGNKLVQNYYSSGLFLVLLALFAFLHIRFIWAVLTAAIILCEYLISIYFFIHTLQQSIVMIYIFLATFIVLSSIISYQIEILARKNYLLKLNIETEKETLEKLVKERTLDLNESHKFLIDEISEKQQLELKVQHIQHLESLALIAGGVAHDFNNLLTGITCSAELARYQLTRKSKFNKNLDSIENGAKKAVDLTQRLLAFSRQQDMNSELLNPNELVTNLLKMLERLIGEHIEFKLNLSPATKMIFADKHQLEQVITNLSVNAQDAMPTGGTLTISTSYEKNGNMVAISVSDTGTGMNKETMRRIFDPFFTTKEISSSIGLGLATSFGTVKQLGGKLSVTSTLGLGSEFIIELPAANKENLS